MANKPNQNDDLLDGNYPRMNISQAEKLGFTDIDEYFMGHKQRGTAIIINNKDFHPNTGLNTRDGTNLDASRLEGTFLGLGFDTEVYHNRTALQILTIVEQAVKRDYSQCDCFIFVLLSHGDERDIIYGSDQPLNISTLTEPFKRSANSLLGKPKIFIFQACRGQQVMTSHRKLPMKDNNEVINIASHIPAEADFLLVYSTMPGYYAWRNSLKGSWFIQALCDMLRDHGHEWDLLRILTKVNRRVGMDYYSNCSDPYMNQRQQIPVFVSTLTKDVKLFPKIK
ncbi:unnamed protein product [Rotaria sordida]|uniref:Caspase-3 n=1 Tax=Rotaria sordida TaxID=392033 RepID=A0A813ZJ12_9BILA|nr:unnamed protein product [Rotaria sordida]CAF0838451.1 unnamed protein product [Rotaria sordida]CAF0856454.1 unnamed protein product [Rotaria sordida]CAF0900214.1 unnamed protein product [Rotaria sordida]CAF0906827.1 unnamed protein product [Rotaria sordida]